VTRYVDLLSDLMLVRRLRPFHANVKKRLVKAPRVYIRDSGLVHALLGISDFNTLSGHPVAGPSWEGFVIENLLSAAPTGTASSFYRTSAGAEIDLILDLPGAKGRWAIEVKRSLSPRVERGFHVARGDVGAHRSFVVYPGTTRYPLTAEVEAIGLHELAGELATM
jgi:predicted AAA+ superfamily ATPase